MPICVDEHLCQFQLIALKYIGCILRIYQHATDRSVATDEHNELWLSLSRKSSNVDVQHVADVQLLHC